MTYCDRWHDKTTSESAGLKCPYCGYFDSSAYELFHGIDESWQEVKCGICDKTFSASRSISITYYGAPAEKPE